MIEGYKCFDKNMNNRYGKHFEVGKIYYSDKEIKYGVNGNGYHFCAKLEDTLRFFDGINEEIALCEIIGFGNHYETFDDYNGYYELYVASNILIKKQLSRIDIINHVNEMNESSFIRFIQGFKLIKEEILFYENKYKNSIYVLNSIDYYQKGDKEAFQRIRN